MTTPDLLVIHSDRPARPFGRLHHGLMTEEINHSYDGGLYAELLRNRAFRDAPDEPTHWSAFLSSPGVNATAQLRLDRDHPRNAVIPASLRVEVVSAGRTSPAGAANHGYWGVPIRPATRYRAVVHAKTTPGADARLTVALRSGDGAQVFAAATLPALTVEWTCHEVVLETAAGFPPLADGIFTLTLDAPGVVWLGFVSLFPPTWNDRQNGLRPDLMRMLVDLRPGFLRFPGGNFLEGDTVELRFKWWETLGPVHERPGRPSCWGYPSSDGMGLLEFLLWCEDLGAEPVLGLYAGYSLKGEHVPAGPELDPFIQEALDEIEYVIGPVTTTWGARRAADGHPEPFPLRYVEIGNEDWFDQSLSYDDRYARFHDAIKARYPDLNCISSIGTEQPAEKLVRSRRPDVIDEHYYRHADVFLKMSPDHFAGYDRSGPEIFVGEWAAHETSFFPWDARSRAEPPTPDLFAALGDAAFLCAMERAGDLVTLQCYAPLLARVEGYQWRPNLIAYDGLHVFGAPSYHVIRLCATLRGDEILDIAPPSDSPLQTSLTRDACSGLLFLKVVNPDPNAPRSLRLDLSGLPPRAPWGRAHTIGGRPGDTNSIHDRNRITPVVAPAPLEPRSPVFVLPPFSFTVIELPPAV